MRLETQEIIVDIPEWLPQEARVFNVFLRQGPMTIAEAARQVGMSTASCFNHVERLCASRCLEVMGEVHRNRWGKRAKIYGVKGHGHGAS